MSLADRTPKPKKRGGVCSVALLYEQIPEEDVDTLRGWLADEQYETSGILQRIKDEYNHRHDGCEDNGDCPPDLVTFGYSPMRRHRALECKCDRL